MRPFRYLAFFLFACVPAAWAADDSTPATVEGVVVGYDRYDGLMLVRELNCVACHAAPEHPVLLERPAPRLANVGSRVSPDYLRAFLTQPHVAKTGTPMPDVLASLNVERKAAAVEGKSVRLVLDELRPYYVHEVRVPGLRSIDGQPVLHPVGYYTLNRDSEVKLYEQM